MLSKFFFILLCFIIFLGSFNSVKAINVVPAKADTTVQIEEIEIETSSRKYEPFVMIAIGASLRVDQANLIDHSPMKHAKIYYSLSEKLSAKFGIGYSTSSKFKSSAWEVTEYENFRIETGFRWNLTKTFFTLYHENGLEYNYYSESQSDIWEHRIGVNVSMGIIFQINEMLNLDIAIGQTINNVNFGKTKNINPSISPIGIKDERFFNEVFNPLSIQLLLFKNL